MRNKIFIIIPVFNRLSYTKKCLSSLENQTYRNFEVIIVDDGSNDGTSDYIKEKYPYWHVIRGNSNWWWTKSMYIGIEYALKYSKPNDFILSLNNDCYAKKDYLFEIINASKMNKRAIVGSLVVDADNPKKIIESGVRINWQKNLIYANTDKLSELSNYINDKNIISEVDTLPGKGTLIPIEVFEKIGNFNYSRLPHYISDYEFFIRAKRNGIKLIVSSKAKLYNFSKETGTTHLTGFKSSYKEVFNVLFSRKSKLNIIDYFNFLLLSSPKKYFWSNMRHFIKRLMYFVLNLSPFCYLGLVASKILLFFHNLPIIIRQLNKQSMGKYKCKICNGYTYLKHKDLFDDRHGYPKTFDIYKCFDCGFMQTQPQLSIDQLSDIYTKYYPKRDADIDSIISGSKNIPTKKQIENNGWNTTCHFQTKKNQKVLDIGCGTCQSLLEIKNMGGKSWGIDPDRNSKHVADKLMLNFHLGTIHDYNANENFFDLITASQVIEHESDPLKFLIECKKYIKKTGKIVLSFPNTNALSLKIYGKKWLHWHIPYHLNHFNKTSFEILAKNAGLKIKSIKTVTPNLWTILQIKSLLNNTQIGHRNYMWDGNNTDDKNATKTSNFQKIVLKILPFINTALIFNRVLDKIGLGESLILELRK